MNTELVEWVMLSLVPGLGARGAAQLVRALGSPHAALNAPRARLAAQTLSREALLGMSLPHLAPEADRILEEAHRSGTRILTLADADYPDLLKEIFDPPIIMYVRGQVETVRKAGIAIVGTRKPTHYGKQVAERLAAELAERGLMVISGLARGIDTAAHRGTVKSDGQTVAVLGSGVDVIYPPENKRFAQTILDSGGALISEFPLGSFPAPQNFPIRNRVISGIALGTVVVEASEYSGSLITARMALEQNREVFAVPGSVTSKTSVGPNYLIQQGAKLVQTWRDVVEELPSQVREQALREPKVSPPAELPLLEDSEANMLEGLRDDVAVQFDELCRSSHLAPGLLQEILLNLELKGYVKQLPGKNFVRLTS